MDLSCGQRKIAIHASIQIYGVVTVVKCQLALAVYNSPGVLSYVLKHAIC
jgi:hypothetical protein